MKDEGQKELAERFRDFILHPSSFILR